MAICAQNSISVIVPAYNCAATLARCVESVQNALKGLPGEIIIINDGSTDSTELIAREIAKSSEIVSVISRDNQGVSSARNAGIKHAKGKYVAFVDSDDWIEAPYTQFKSLLGALTAHNADIAICGYTASSATQSLSLENNHYERSRTGDFDRLIQIKSLGKPYGKLIKRELLTENGIFFPGGMKHQEDAVFLYRVLAKAASVVTVSDATYHYVLPQSGKNYFVRLSDQLTGYKQMSFAVDDLIESLPQLSAQAKERLEMRKTGLALHVFSSLQQESRRHSRIDAYKQVNWTPVLPYLHINPLMKRLLRKGWFSLFDFVSNLSK